jgi:hypothetical protein
LRVLTRESLATKSAAHVGIERLQVLSLREPTIAS